MGVELDTPGRVLVAFDDGPFVEEPTWTRLDVDSLVHSIEISTGAQDEFDETKTGTARVVLNDRDGTFDRLNIDSPYYGKLDSKQIVIQLYNPVTDTWHSRFRGWVHDYFTSYTPSQRIAYVTIECVDIFDYLSGVHFMPGVHGDVPADQTVGPVVYAEEEVNDRFISVLDNVGIQPAFYVIFDGNVVCCQSKYDSDDTAIVALRDAADAEFPGIANIYVDRFGRFVFHGRGARIDPVGVSAGAGDDAWDFQVFPVADGANADATTAQIRPEFELRGGVSTIINACLMWPRDTDQEQIGSLVFKDDASIDEHGFHSLSFTDIQLLEHKTNGNTAEDECLLYSMFYVQNYAQPIDRIEQITIREVVPTHAQASGTWNILTRSDISDQIFLEINRPGRDAGISDTFYIEGWRQTIRKGRDDYDIVELTLNVSPAALYTENVWS